MSTEHFRENRPPVDEAQYQIPFGTEETTPPEDYQPGDHERIDQPGEPEPQVVVAERTDHFPRLPHTEERKKRSWGKRAMIAAGVAVTAVITGTVVGVVGAQNSGNDNDPLDPKQRPVATAPANPGGESLAPNSEVASANPNTLPEGFEYQLGGMKYETEEDFIAANEVSAEEYPDGKDALPKLVEMGFNGKMLAGANIKENEENQGYKPHPDVPAGSMSLAKFVYQPAISKAIAIKDIPFIESNVNRAALNYVNLTLGSANDPGPFIDEWKYEGHQSAQRSIAEVETYWEADAVVTHKNNADEIPRVSRIQSSINETHKLSITIQKVPGVKGNLTWKFMDISPGATMAPKINK